MTKKPTDDVTYAKDCVWVYENIGLSVEEVAKETGSRKALFAWVANPENMQEFLRHILPKAQDALLKARSNRDPDTIVEKESKKIAELKDIIQNAVDEATE